MKGPQACNRPVFHSQTIDDQPLQSVSRTRTATGGILTPRLRPVNAALFAALFVYRRQLQATPARFFFREFVESTRTAAQPSDPRALLASPVNSLPTTQLPQAH